MKSLGKTLLISSFFSALALAGTCAQATPKTHAVSEEVNTQHKIHILLLPQITSEGNSQQQPLLSKSSSDNSVHRTCKTKKKNELYELSAIFNDKLQMFLSYFDEHQSYKMAGKSESADDLSASNNIHIQ